MFVLSFLFIAAVTADVFMHNPRGSNDRNCERNDNRNNGNRLFDSQNNDKGGYACPRAVGGAEVHTPRMYYYQGSELRVEWTSQHGCGSNAKVHCEAVIQYMCEDANPLISDGIPTSGNDAATDRMDESDYLLSMSTNPDDQKEFKRYGYHETYEFFKQCEYRERNMGLWISDQNVNNNQGATATRQQANQNRRGWECQEERDYYPYWHPQPWKDIAILTWNEERCNWYQSESQNVKAVNECRMSPNPTSPSSSIGNNEVECVSRGGQWTTVPSKGLPPPHCRIADWERDNHLGSGADGEMSKYLWTIPEVECESAVLRIRYNISTADLWWDLDSRYNSEKVIPSGFLPNPVVTSPNMQPWGDMTYNLTVKTNTNQYGRTFEDRSYLFSIKPLPSDRRRGGVNEVAGKIYNLNVRGKRGNIVQAFPAVEYDFVPTRLELTEADYIHIQWTGSDYNPNRNPNNGNGGPQDPAQPGNYRSDRSNMVQIDSFNDNVPSGNPTLFGSDEERFKFAYINQDLSTCLSYSELRTRNNGNNDQIFKDSRNCMKLNAASTPYFDGGIVKGPTQVGTYYYMSTRANNFSNRAQKGALIVKEPGMSATAKAAIGLGVGSAVVGAAGVGSYAYAKKNPTSIVAKGWSKLM